MMTEIKWEVGIYRESWYRKRVAASRALVEIIDFGLIKNERLKKMMLISKLQKAKIQNLRYNMHIPRTSAG